MKWVLSWWLLALANWSIAADLDRPHVLVLGIAQDAGLPHIGCNLECCRKAAEDSRLRRMASSLLLVDPESGRRWLFDATPDIREQTRVFAVSSKEGSGKRPKLVDGIFLTHAHMGHYTGLLHLGREAYSHPEIPVYASARMCRFLAENGPWRLLIENKNIALNPLKPDLPFKLDERIQVEPFNVPHREELSDTFGYLIKGPNRSVLYVPDIDKWERWDRAIESMIARADIALLDGTFFADGEIPGRSLASIPHPFISESLQRFKSLPEKEKKKIVFIHLNHTNPAIFSRSRARAQIEAAGMSVAEEGQVISL